MLTATSQERGGPAESGSALGAEVGGRRLPLTDSGGTSLTMHTAFPQFRGHFGKTAGSRSARRGATALDYAARDVAPGPPVS